MPGKSWNNLRYCLLQEKYTLCCRKLQRSFFPQFQISVYCQIHCFFRQKVGSHCLQQKFFNVGTNGCKTSMWEKQYHQLHESKVQEPDLLRIHKVCLFFVNMQRWYREERQFCKLSPSTHWTRFSWTNATPSLDLNSICNYQLLIFLQCH
jgi:hypothetical protein